MTQDPKWAQAIHAELGVVDASYARLDAIADGGSTESLASADAQLPLGGFAWIFAAVGLQVALDHMRSWKQLHRSGMQPPFAHWTLLRGAVEGAALTRWICAGSTSEERRGRGVGAQIADFEQRLAFETRVAQAMPKSPKPKVSARARIRDLRQRGAVARLRSVPPPGPVSLVGQYVPAVWDVDSEVLYRTVSAFAHSKMWGMSILSSYVVGKAVPNMAASSVEFTAADDLVYLVTHWAANATTRAVDDFENYSR